MTPSYTLKHQLASLYSNRAAASTMMRHYHEALSDCDSAIAVDASYDKPHVRKAQLLVMNGMLSEALETLKHVLLIDPHNTRAAEESKDVQWIQQKYVKANEFFRQLEDNQDYTSPEEIMERSNDIDAIVEKCIAWNEPKVLQAQALWALGQSEEAYDLTNKLVKQVGMTENSQLHFLRAQIFVSMGKSEEAIMNLRTVLAHDRDHERAVVLYAKLKEFLECKAVADRHYKARRYDDALEQYQVAMRYCPSPAYMAKLYFNRACTHASLGRHDMSIQDCSESIKLNDEYIKAYMRRAASLRMMVTDKERWYESAISDYETARTLCKTKQQSREIYKKLRDTQLELYELHQYELDMRKKMQRRHTAPMVVTPDCSPAEWMRKSAPGSIFRVRTKTEDSDNFSMPRSRASSASSWNPMEMQ